MASTSPAITFLSATPAPQRSALSCRGHNGRTFSFTQSTSVSKQFSTFSLSSSSSKSSITSAMVEEEEKQEEEESSPIGTNSPQDSDALPPTRGCKACGREELERGCNGEGRIQGGIATFPGFGWWPIKAYRPCPGFVASGGRYQRRGQSMDEVAFGGGQKGVSMGIDNEAQSSKKKGGLRRFKR
ncbi:uncharacterized protein LOC127813269 [Diospyros lotus]|uniref:uncharacterized protein LOC127813269 n=1 Tax=Diospyros lotus TaxID=55363 RepID=UPI0022588580|nr:uncharacterized protein LOC127813269 [Diospyros lotus]